MKMTEVETPKPKPAFEPITLQITLESEDELKTFAAKMYSDDAAPSKNVTGIGILNTLHGNYRGGMFFLEICALLRKRGLFLLALTVLLASCASPHYRIVTNDAAGNPQVETFTSRDAANAAMLGYQRQGRNAAMEEK